jgi:type IV secretory pathway TrbD component
MQSASAPTEPLKIGYYLWLAAIGAIVYAYVFATSRAEMANTTLTPIVDASNNIINDPTTVKPMMNTGHRVITLLPFVWLYAVLTKGYYSFQYTTILVKNVNVIPIINIFLTLGTLIGLVFVSIGATQSNDPLAKMEIKGSERTGWVTTNFVFIGIIFILVVFLLNAVSGWTHTQDRDIKIFSGLLAKMSTFVFSFWFPFMMMVYLVKTGATDWFRIVAVVSIVMAIAYNLYNLFKIYYKPIAPLNDALTTCKESIRYFTETSPIFSYLKFVTTNDLIDIVAKKVLIFALLCYVAYLMISVYKFKNSLVPCVSTHFASCFWDPEFKETGYDPNKNTPYINALFYTLMMTMGVNILNYIIVLFGPELMNTWVMIRIKNWFNNTTNTAAPVPPSPDFWEIAKTFFLLSIFPFTWIVKLFVQHPIITIVAFIAFAAIGVLLYRSSFDLTAFIEGQRGTVITLFTLFIASLILFGVYMYNSNKAPSGSSSSSNSSSSGNTNSSGSSSSPTYSEFILRPMMFIAVAACVIGIVSYFFTSQSRLVTMANLLQYGITALIYIVGIAIVIGIARTMFSMSRKMGDSMFQTSEDSNWVINVLKLIGNVLFYLPCLMLDFVDMLKEQYGLTTHAYLLAAAAAFILAGLYLPSLVTKAINHTGVQIVSAPISMTTSTKITRYTVQFVESKGVVSHASGPNPLPPLSTSASAPTTTPAPTPTMNPTDIKLHNYSYGVSAWFYIHPHHPNTQSDSTKSANMFKFGDGTIGPNVSYTANTNSVHIAMNESGATIPPIKDVPLQRWNNVVINSDKGAIDIFMNGRLVYTGTHLQPVNNAKHNVVIGYGKEGDENKDDDAKDKTFGIQGELCNMVLKHDPFTNAEITWFYETNKMMNPPVVGVNPDPLNQGDSASYLASQSVSNKIVDNEYNVDKTPNNPLSLSTYGARTYGILGAFFGAIFGWLFNRDDGERVKGLLMGTVVFGLIGAVLGALFSTDGTVANIMKTVANVFVNTF